MEICKALSKGIEFAQITKETHRYVRTDIAEYKYE